MDADNIWLGVVGAATAAFLGWRKFPIMVVVLGAAATVMLAYQIL